MIAFWGGLPSPHAHRHRTWAAARGTDGDNRRPYREQSPRHPETLEGNLPLVWHKVTGLWVILGRTIAEVALVGTAVAVVHKVN